MLRSQQDEDLVVKWAVFEIVNYLKQTNRSWCINEYLNPTKAHKILYGVFEKNEIPVTRSWYRYGCFIHSCQLSTSDSHFSALRNRFIRTKDSSLRTQARSLGIAVESVAEDIAQATEAMPNRVDEYIENLYFNNVPDGLGNIYQSKFKLANLLGKTEGILARRNAKFEDWLSEVRSSFSLFQMAAFSNPWFNDLTEITLDFTSTTEQALLKAESILQSSGLSVKQAWCLNGLRGFFDGKIWLPFALKTSAETVKGIRKNEVAAHQMNKHFHEVQMSAIALSELSRELGAMNLTLSWSEYADSIKNKQNNEFLRNKICEMEKLYDSAPLR